MSQANGARPPVAVRKRRRTTSTSSTALSSSSTSKRVSRRRTNAEPSSKASSPPAPSSPLFANEDTSSAAPPPTASSSSSSSSSSSAASSSAPSSRTLSPTSTSTQAQYTASELREDTPSRRVGITYEAELKRRMELVRLTQQACVHLGLSSLTAASACTVLHAFYMLEDLQQYRGQRVAAACILLASKVEEDPRRARDIINAVHICEQPTDPLRVGAEFWKRKDDVIALEQRLLRILRFQLNFKHPHHYVLHFVSELGTSEEMGRAAWNIVNDSLRCMLCLQFSPQAIACSAIFLAAELLGAAVSHPLLIPTGDWWTHFGVRKTDIESISATLLNMYEFHSVLEDDEPTLQMPEASASPEVVHPRGPVPATPTSPLFSPTASGPPTPSQTRPTLPHMALSGPHPTYPVSSPRVPPPSSSYSSAPAARRTAASRADAEAAVAAAAAARAARSMMG